MASSQIAAQGTDVRTAGPAPGAISLPTLGTLMRRVNVTLDPLSFIEAIAMIFQEVRAKGERESMERRFRTEPSFQLFQNALRLARRSGVQSVVVLGCGPGFAGEPADFASSVVHEIFGSEELQKIAALNLSPAILRHDPEALFANAQLGIKQGASDLIVVHSLLHYVLDIAPVFALVRRLLKPSGGLILSHEPNARFWQNTACQSAVADLRRSRRGRLRRYLTATRTFGRFRRVLRQPPTIWDKVNLRLKQRYGMTGSLAENEIRRLVDIHRPEAVPGTFRIGLNGFDFDELSQFYLSDFRLEWVATSGHLGYDTASALTPQWRRKAITLAADQPLAGCVFTAYWKRGLAP
jgi:SAM-dependent methyltransferase